MNFKFKKLIASHITILFLFNTLAYSAPASPGLSLIHSQTPRGEVPVPVFDLDIPASLGKVERLFQAERNRGFVIHIQDAHGSYQAQKNIRRLLNYLKKQYGVKLVFLEGGASALTPAYFHFFDEPERNHRIAKRLMRKGLLTGAEVFLIEQARETESFGIENVRTYRQDIELFRKVLARSQESREFLQAAEQRCQMLETKMMSRELRKFLKAWKVYRKDPSSLLRFTGILENEAQKVLGLALQAPAHQDRFPSLLRILKIKNLEQVLDFKKSAEEKEALIRSLETRLGKKGKPWIKRLRTLEKSKNPRRVFEKLFEQDREIDFSAYPHFKAYAQYLIFQSEIDSREFFNEIETLSSEIFSRLAKTKEEQSLIEAVRQALLLEKLFALELTREEYRQILDAPFLPSSLAGLLHSEPRADSAALDVLFEDALDFYRVAEKRERHFIDNLFQTMKEKQKDRAVIVTGGFHSDGVTRQLEARGISYAEVSPRMKPDEKGRRLYLETMLGKEIFQKAQIANVAEIDPLETQAEMSALLEERVPEVLGEVLREGKRGGADRKTVLARIAAGLFGRQLFFDFKRTSVAISFRGSLLARYGLLTQEPASLALAASLGSQEPGDVRLDLPAIEASLRGIVTNWDQINARLDTGRERPSPEMMSKILSGYGFLDQMLERGAVLEPENVFGWNMSVLYGNNLSEDDFKIRLRFNEAIQLARDKFYGAYHPDSGFTTPGTLEQFWPWYERRTWRRLWAVSPFSHAAAMYAQGLSRPQLFVEGNHRTGALFMSWVLVRAGFGPFVMSAENAVEYLDLSADIKFSKRENWTTAPQFWIYRRRFAKFLESQSESSKQYLASSLGAEKIRGLLKGANEVLHILDGQQSVPAYNPFPFAAILLADSGALIGGMFVLGQFILPLPLDFFRWSVTLVVGFFAVLFAGHFIAIIVKHFTAAPKQETWGGLADRFAEGAQRLKDLYPVRKTRMGGKIDFELPWGRRDEIPWDQVFLHDSTGENQTPALAAEHAQSWTQHMSHLSRGWFEEWQRIPAKFSPARKDFFYHAMHDALLLGAGRFRAKFLIEEIKASEALSEDKRVFLSSRLASLVQDAEQVLKPWLGLLARVKRESGVPSPFPFTEQRIAVTRNYGPAFSDALNHFREGIREVSALLEEAALPAGDQAAGASLGAAETAAELFEAIRREPILGGARHHEDLSDYLSNLEPGQSISGISTERYFRTVDYVSNHLARILLAENQWPLSVPVKRAFKALLLENIHQFRALGMYPEAVRMALVKITPGEAKAALARLENAVIGTNPDGKEVKVTTENQAILLSALKNRVNPLTYVDSYLHGLQEAYKAAAENFLAVRNEVSPRILAMPENAPALERQKLLMRNRDNASIHHIARTIALKIYTNPDPAAKARKQVDTIFNLADQLLSKEPRITPGSVWMMAVRASEYAEPVETADIFAARWQGAYALAEELDVAAKTAAADQFYTSEDWEAKTRMTLKYYALAKNYAAELGYEDLAGSIAGHAMFEKSEDAVRALVDRLIVREKKAREAARETELKPVEKSVGGHAVLVGKGAEDSEEAVIISLDRERRLQERRKKEREEWLAGLSASERFKTMTTTEVKKAIRDAVRALTDENQARGLADERAKPTAAEVEAKLGLNAGSLFHIMRYRRYRLNNPSFPNFTEFGIRSEKAWFNLEEPAVLEQKIRDAIADLTQKNIAAGKSLKKGAAKPTVAEVAQALEITPEQLMDVVSRRRSRGTVPFPSLIEMGAKRDRSKPPSQAASLGMDRRDFIKLAGAAAGLALAAKTLTGVRDAAEKSEKPAAAIPGDPRFIEAQEKIKQELDRYFEDTQQKMARDFQGKEASLEVEVFYHRGGVFRSGHPGGPKWNMPERRMEALDGIARRVWAGLPKDALPGYIKNKSASENLQITLFIFSVLNPSGYAFLETRKVPIYWTESEAFFGTTRGSRNLGFSGAPIISLNKIFLGRPFHAAAILTHETEHAKRLPRGLGGAYLDMLGNITNLFNIFTGSLPGYEKPSFAAEEAFLSKLYIKPDFTIASFGYLEGQWGSVGLSLLAWAPIAGAGYAGWQIYKKRREKIEAKSLGDIRWRAQDLERIQRFIQAHSGPKLMLISGERSGAGKTTLLRQMRYGVVDIGLHNRSDAYFTEGGPFVGMFSEYRRQGVIQETYAEPVSMQLLEKDMREAQAGRLDLKPFKGMDQNYFLTFLARHQQELFRPENEHLLAFEDFNALEWTSDKWQWASFPGEASQTFLSIPILKIYLLAEESGERVMIFDETTLQEEKAQVEAQSLGDVEDQIEAEKEKGRLLMDDVLARLRAHHHEDIAVILNNLYSMALPYFVESRASNPVYHAAEVTDFASEILLGEGVSKNELKRGLAAALLHDAGLAIAKAGKLSKAAIMQAPPGPERERLKKEAIRLRKLHMRDGSKLAGDLLAQYNERFGPIFSARDIRAIKHVIFNHDNPSIQEYEETNDGQWLFKPGERLLMFHREADRLTMLTENEMEMERKKAEGKGQAFDAKEKFSGNIKRHQEEMELYRAAFGEPGIQAYGFKKNTLYRTATGYAIFRRVTTEFFGRYGIPVAENWGDIDQIVDHKGWQHLTAGEWLSVPHVAERILWNHRELLESVAQQSGYPSFLQYLDGYHSVSRQTFLDRKADDFRRLLWAKLPEWMMERDPVQPTVLDATVKRSSEFFRYPQQYAWFYSQLLDWISTQKKREDKRTLKIDIIGPAYFQEPLTLLALIRTAYDVENVTLDDIPLEISIFDVDATLFEIFEQGGLVYQRKAIGDDLRKAHQKLIGAPGFKGNSLLRDWSRMEGHLSALFKPVTQPGTHREVVALAADNPQANAWLGRMHFHVDYREANVPRDVPFIFINSVFYYTDDREKQQLVNAAKARLSYDGVVFSMLSRPAAAKIDDDFVPHHDLRREGTEDEFDKIGAQIGAQIRRSHQGASLGIPSADAKLLFQRLAQGNLSEGSFEVLPETRKIPRVNLFGFHLTTEWLEHRAQSLGSQGPYRPKPVAGGEEDPELLMEIITRGLVEMRPPLEEMLRQLPREEPGEGEEEDPYGLLEGLPWGKADEPAAVPGFSFERVEDFRNRYEQLASLHDQLAVILGAENTQVASLGRVLGWADFQIKRLEKYARGQSLGDESQVTEALKAWAVAEPYQAEPLRGGIYRTNPWLIKSSQGNFVLIPNAGSHPDQIQWEAGLLEGIRENGFDLAPELLRTKDGALYAEHQGEKFLLYTYQEGETVPWGGIQGAKLVNAAKVQARYHHAVRTVQPGGSPIDNAQRWYPLADMLNVEPARNWLHKARDQVPDNLSERFRSYVEEFLTQYFGKNLDESWQEFFGILESELDQLSQASPAYQSLPKRIIHGDYNSKNILFFKDQVKGVIDFNYARLAPRIQDLANGAIDIRWDSDRVDFSRLLEYLQAYQSETEEKITRQELSALKDAYRAALLEGLAFVLAYAVTDHPGISPQNTSEILRGNLRALKVLSTLDWEREVVDAFYRIEQSVDAARPEPRDGKTLLELTAKRLQAIRNFYGPETWLVIHHIDGRGFYVEPWNAMQDIPYSEHDPSIIFALNELLKRNQGDAKAALILGDGDIKIVNRSVMEGRQVRQALSQAGAPLKLFVKDPPSWWNGGHIPPVDIAWSLPRSSDEASDIEGALKFYFGASSLGDESPAESLGEIDPAFLDEMRMNLDPRWGPDAENLWQKDQRHETWTDADFALYRKITARYNRIVQGEDTEYARRADISGPIRESTVMAATMEAMLSGTRLDETRDILADVNDLWSRQMSGRETIEQADLEGLEREVKRLQTEVIQGNYVSNFNGGLGVLMGDEFGAWADLGAPSSLDPKEEKEKGNFLALGLFYKQGVFVSSVDAKGRQRITFAFQDQKLENPVTTTLRYPAGHLKENQEVVLEIPLRNHHKGYVKVEVARVGRVKMLLFNPDIPENDGNPAFRESAGHVYKGKEGTDERFIQEWILGVGSVALMRELGLHPGAIHLNESATAFMVPALVKYYMETEGVSDVRALELVSNSLVFTTHTLEPASMAKYPLSDVRMYEYFQSLFGADKMATVEWLLEMARANGDIHPLWWLGKNARRRNAVSTLNAREAVKSFREFAKKFPAIDKSSEIDFIGITNGVRRPFWQPEWLQEKIESLAGGVDDLLDPRDPHHRALWERLNPEKPVALPEVSPVSDAALWEGKRRMKQRMIAMVRLYVAEGILENIREWQAKNVRDQKRLNENYTEALAAKIKSRNDRIQELWVRLQKIPVLLDEDSLTASWARRIQDYKRMLFAMVGGHLPDVEKRIAGGNLSDEDIAALVRELKDKGAFAGFEDLISQGMQFVFAGKTHPQNKEGLVSIRLLHHIIREFGWEGRVVYVPKYDEKLAKALVQGSDLWFASSEIPREASGTSGQKAMMSGTVLLSTLDGFARDGVEHKMNGLIYGKHEKPPKDEIAKKQYVAEEHANFHAVLTDALQMYREGPLPAKWINLMRASIYYSSRVFSMEGVELGRIVPPEGLQKGYFEQYSGAAQDLARELFLTKFRKAEPRVRVAVSTKKPGQSRAVFSVRIPYRRSFDPLSFDYYFWYGKKTDLIWKPLRVKTRAHQGILRISAMVELPQEVQAVDYGMTYFAVPKGTPVMEVSKDHWGQQAIWRVKTNGQDIYFQIPGRQQGQEEQDAPGASLGERSDFRAREFLVGEGRSLDSVLEVAIRLTDGVLWIKGNPEVLRRLMEKLGLFKKARNVQTGNSFGGRFNNGALDLAVREYLGKNAEEKTGRGNMPFILFDKVLDIDSDQVSRAVKEFAGQLEQGDFVAVVWKHKIPAFFEGLSRIQQARHIEVRAVREELAGSNLPHWMKSHRGPAVVVSSVDAGVMELNVKGQKVALHLKELNQAGIHPVKVLALLRQIGDDTEAYGKLGFMRDKEKGFWVVGSGFVDVLRRLDAEHIAELTTGKAA